MDAYNVKPSGILLACRTRTPPCSTPGTPRQTGQTHGQRSPQTDPASSPCDILLRHPSSGSTDTPDAPDWPHTPEIPYPRAGRRQSAPCQSG